MDQSFFEKLKQDKLKEIAAFTGALDFLDKEGYLYCFTVAINKQGDIRPIIISSDFFGEFDQRFFKEVCLFIGTSSTVMEHGKLTGNVKDVFKTDN